MPGAGRGEVGRGGVGGEGRGGWGEYGGQGWRGMGRGWGGVEGDAKRECDAAS